jgi:F0F1-type ATP synthase assembly protein I
MKSLTRKLVPKNTQNLSSQSMGRGMELAVSVLVFTLIGFALDAAFDTLPWITVSLIVFSTVGNFVRMYYSYNAQMNALEEARRTQSGAQR